MNNTNFIANLVEPYSPQLPIDQLVIEMNRLYHSFEANIYDTRHPEIYEQLPLYWKEMIDNMAEQSKLKPWRILDFGCGTGFEAQQLLKNMPENSIAALTCYDPSPEMLEQCRAKISPLFPKSLFCSSLEEVQSSNEPYTILITNSVLHHLSNVSLTINSLLPLLDANALWLAGHEPSLRFYKNIECVKKFEAFLRVRRWSPSNYSELLKRIAGIKSSLYAKTAREAVRIGFFKQKPPARVIDRLVDFHVAHSTWEITAGQGFDYLELEQMFQSSWHLIWLKTYNFMGHFYEGELPHRYIRSCRELAQHFPYDGANFCMIWQRIPHISQ